MSIEERKARLVSIILDTKEDELIEMLEEDVTHYQQHSAKDADGLSPEELAELKELMEEPAEKYTISFKEFKAEMAQWRKGSL
jgi:hypothetical protein